MSTAPKTDVRTDLESLCESLYLRRPVDPTIAQRVQERAEAIRQDLRKSGPTQFADQLLRESRDE